MANRKWNNYIIVLAFLAYIVYYRLFITVAGGVYTESINAAAMTILTAVAIFLLGFRKDKMNKVKKNILVMTIIEILLFFSISFGLGLVPQIGFLKNSYALNFLSIVDNIFAPIVFIVATELFRYTVVNANKDKKSIVWITTILIIILELIMNLQGVLMYNFETIFKTVSAIILPIIIKNAVLTYVTQHGGYKPTVAYRLVMDLYGFVLPIIPNLGDYINSVIGILLPTLIYMYSSRIVEESTKEDANMYTKQPIRIGDIPIIIFIILLVMLISGNFKYALIGVGSESMMPKIAKGDAVVYEAVDSADDFEVGDILVFKSGSKIIIHRLVDIKQEKDGSTYYVTKGDANNGNDSLHLTLENIKGRVMFKIKYLAYPNLFLQDLLNNKK